MMGLVWSLLTGNPIARMLAKVGGLVLLVVTFGAWQRRDAVRDDRAKRDLADAKETIKAHEVRNEVDDRVAREPDARGKLRADWSE